MKAPNQEHDRKTFIANYGATSHILNSEENMSNLKDSKTLVTVGYSRKITGAKCGNWHIWHRLDIILQRATLTNMAVIPGPHTNIFSVTRAQKNIFSVTSEGETQILKKIPSIFV